ncbi:MAG TPA: redox-regulated ATPase YchF, partial [Chloroflexi bacterium]|nr:redox-regulated ATPase YchF [Chloroflexota bacterium]
MGLQIGIVGLPNVGKSTLFNALTRAGATVAAYPFTTIEPNRGIVVIPDRRLDVLAEMVTPERVTPATVKFVDIAGLVRGAHRGEGLGNQFLGHIRDVDAIAVVCRCFADVDVSHVEGEVNPVRDLEVTERRLDKVRTAAKARPRDYAQEMKALEELRERLQAGQQASEWAALGETEATLAADIRLLTAKKRIYLANVGEADLPEGNPWSAQIAQI